MSAKKKQHYYLLPDNRVADLNAAFREFVEAVDAIQRKYKFDFHCSIDGNFIEVLPPEDEPLPEGYGYAGTITIDEGEFTTEVCELLPEDRPITARRRRAMGGEV